MPSPTTTAQVIHAFGGPEQLDGAELPVVAPTAGQVRIAVAAAAVNPVDLTTRAGVNIPEDAARFPMVLGWDAAGTVTELGDGVEGRRVGDRVAAMSFQPAEQVGTYAGSIVLAADLLAPVPDDLTLEQAATLPLAGLTATQLVAWLALPAGATVLLDGPLGAVGRLVLQLASRAGLRVTAVARSDRREEAIRLGATHVVDRDDPARGLAELHPDGVDGAIDLVGGAAASAALAAVRDGGAYVSAVPPYIDPTGPSGSQRGIRFEFLTVRADPGQLTELLRAAAAGELTTAIQRAYPLADAAEAHRRQARGGLTGKLLLLP